MLQLLIGTQQHYCYIKNKNSTKTFRNMKYSETNIVYLCCMQVFGPASKFVPK